MSQIIEFRLARHTHRPGEVVEVWLIEMEGSEQQGGRMVGAIYPTNNGFRLLSRHIKTMRREQDDDLFDLEVEFKGKGLGK